MLKPADILVWMQTTARRDASVAISSVELSDIRQRFILCEDRKDRHFPGDYADLQAWWDRKWREMVSVARVRRCSWILRLEDDIEVNRHILHNLCTWSALQSPLFGLGTLFEPNYWKSKPELFKTDHTTGAVYRNSKDVEGAQGQIVSTELISSLLDGVPMARHLRGLGRPEDQPSFDWALSRVAWSKGLRVFVHRPALVNVTDVSRYSKIDLQQHKTGAPHPISSHYFGDRAFDKNWCRQTELELAR